MREVVDDLANRLWPARVRSIEALVAGITNSNYVVDLGDERVVVRVPGSETGLLGIDRVNEVNAARLASAIGVGPEVLCVDESTGCIVTRFIEGRIVAIDELCAEPMLAHFVHTLRQVHAAGVVDVNFDAYQVVRAYADVARERDVRPPFDTDSAVATVARVALARPFRGTVLGHNDLLNANFLFDGLLRIVDWEYAGMADPFFDLANVSVNNSFPVESDVAMIGHYFGHVNDEVMATLHLMKIVSELREAMWGVVQMAISTLDVDFSAYAAERGEHALALAREYDLDELLELAAHYRDLAT